MRIELNTDRLLLRDYSPDDLTPFAAMSKDKKFQRFYSEQDCSEIHWQKLVNQFSQEHSQAERTDFNLAIVMRETGLYIGAVGIRIEAHQQASVGCALIRHQQQSGVAIEAMRAIAEFGFLQLDVHRIYAETIADNHAAIRLCRQLGMRKEAEFVEHRYFKEKWWNTVIFGLLKSQYKF
jgi:RimJ/RimL family protein N-acetyltransferase